MTATDDATGMTEVECAMCNWTQPAGRHTTPGTAERPIGADYIDAVMPRIGTHIDETGHPVRVTITTYWPDRDDEHSSMIMAPATDHDWVAVLERHETQLGCVTCGCTEPESGWQGRVSSPREGWLCGPCNLLRAAS